MCDAVLTQMRPDQEYTAPLLAKVTGIPVSTVRETLRSAVLGGVVTRSKKTGVKGYVYKTKQLQLIESGLKGV